MLAAPFPSPPDDPFTLDLAKKFFTGQFTAKSEKAQQEEAAPITSKLLPLLLHAFLRKTLCAEQNALNLKSLWQEQRVVILHATPAMGEDEAKFLASMISADLFRVALSKPGDRPVVLSWTN